MLFGFDHILSDLRSLIPVGFFQVFLGRSWQLCSSCGRLVLLLEPDTYWQYVEFLIAFGFFVRSLLLLAALGSYWQLLDFLLAICISCTSGQLVAFLGSSL